MSKFFDGLEKYIYWTSIPKIGLNDIVDILIVSVMIYLIVKWIKTTRAWVLLKGIIILLCIAFAAYLLQLHTVSWILSNTMSVGITADFDRLPARTPKSIGTAWKERTG